MSDFMPHREADEARRRARFGWREGLLALAVIAVVVAVYSLLESPERRTRRGRAAADRAWAESRALKYVEEYPLRTVHGKFEIECNYDPESGLKTRYFPIGRPLEWHRGYNERVAELLGESGAPSWSMKSKLIPFDDVIRAGKQSNLKQVTEFPFDLTPGIVLFRKGSVHRWGGTATSGGDGLNINTPKMLLGLGDEINDVSVGAIDGFPERVIVKDGNSWVLLTEGGELLYLVTPRE